MGLSHNRYATATDFVIIWEPKAVVDALIAQMGIGANVTTSTKADGSVKVLGIDACRYANARGVPFGCTGEDTFLVT